MTTTLAHETVDTSAAALAAADTAAATATIWVAAKENETAANKVAKVAKGDRDRAASVLVGMVANGDTVTVAGKGRYIMQVTPVDSSVNGAKVLAALRALHPELATVIASLESSPAYRNQAYTKVNLKRERI